MFKNQLYGYAKNDQQPDMLFIFPVVNWHERFCCQYHIGAAYVRAYLKFKEIYTEQLIHPSHQSIRYGEFINQILQTKAPIIGFTCYHTNFMFIKRVAKTLKKIDPNLTIIAGGPTPTFSSRTILKNDSGIDICVRGEGEFTIFEVIRCLKIGKKMDDVDGISFIRNGKIIRTPDRCLCRGVDRSSALDIFQSPYLNGMIPASTGLETGITTARGCIYRCTYCNYSAISRWTIGYHSVDRVIAELKLIASQCTDDSKNKEIHIHDDCFTLNRRRVIAICNEIIKSDLKLKFWCLTRADRLDRALMEKMYSAGFRTLNFGLESASPQVLRNIKKVFTSKSSSIQDVSLATEKRYLENLRKNTRIAQELGFRVCISAIFGLPGEKMSDAEKTITFINSLKVHRYYHNFLAIYPGTELSKTYLQHNIKKAPTDLQAYPFEYAYDVTQVPRQTNDAIEINPKYMMDLLGTFDGIYPRGQVDELPFPNHIVWCPEKRDKHMDIILNWLARSSDLSTLTLLSEPLEKESYHRLLQKSNHYDLNISKIIRIAELPKKITRINHKNKLLYTLYTKDSPYEGSSIENAQHLSSFKASCLGIFRLDEIKSLNCFLGNISKGNERGYFTFPVFENLHYFTIKDTCRWSNQLCPSVLLPRIYIREGKVYPCTCGPAIGCVGDDINTLRQNAKAIINAIEAERGCDNCQIKNSCSRCPKPFPVSGLDFCTIRRGNPYLSEAFAAFDLGRSTLLLNRLKGGQDRLFKINISAKTASQKNNGIYYQPEAVGIWNSGLNEMKITRHYSINKKIRIIAFDDYAILYRHTDHRFIRLSKQVIEIYEAITRNTTHIALINYLERKYNLSRLTANEWVHQSVNMLASKGYL